MISALQGLYISLLETRHALLVILDTEGLLSVEARDDVFDKQVALMTMACSDLVIVNNRGELGRKLGCISDTRSEFRILTLTLQRELSRRRCLLRVVCLLLLCGTPWTLHGCRSKACGRFVPSLPLCFVSFEVGSDQPSNRFRFTVLKHGESTTAVRMGCYCEAISWRFGSRIATEGDQTQLQVAGLTQKNDMPFLKVSTFLKILRVFLEDLSSLSSLSSLHVYPNISQHISFLVSFCLELFLHCRFHILPGHLFWGWRNSIADDANPKHTWRVKTGTGHSIISLVREDLVFLDSESIFVMPSAFNDDVQFGLQVSRPTNLYALKALQLREKVFQWIARHGCESWWYLMIFPNWYPLISRSDIKWSVSAEHCHASAFYKSSSVSMQGQSISEVSLRWRCWCYAELFRFCLRIFVSVVWPCTNGLADALDVWHRFASIPHYEVPELSCNCF